MTTDEGETKLRGKTSSIQFIFIQTKMDEIRNTNIHDLAGITYTKFSRGKKKRTELFPYASNEHFRQD